MPKACCNVQFLQAAMQSNGHRHRAVLAACAANTDGDPRFPFGHSQESKWQSNPKPWPKTSL